MKRLVFLLLLATAPAFAADRIVRLEPLPPIRKDVAALPAIADPVDEAERKINAALRRLDATMRKTTAGCTDEKGTPGTWHRSVEAPMRGPGFLSLAITDIIDCPARPPGASTMAIVYDLATGAPVDWTRLLPKSLTGKVALETGADGTRMVTLASKRLHELYLTGYRPDEDDPECRDAMKDYDEAPAMMAWLDAKAGGLAVVFDVPRAIQACADPVVIPSAVLRKEGAAARLVDAIDAARKQATP